ncbi:MAG TPA: TOBE domain-containing protein, partial [Candidatus Saccharimonadales bacterium]|nr:TOBE domain-containing protein [Candidatus Saccharimonadales bacterium]
QLGPPRELYNSPHDPFVADFLGEMNFLSGTVESGDRSGCTVNVAGGRVHASAPMPGELPAKGDRVRVAVRPEAISIQPLGDTRAADGEALGHCRVEGTLSQYIFNGANLIVLLDRPDGTILRAHVNPQHHDRDLEIGQPVVATWSSRTAIAFPD